MAEVDEFTKKLAEEIREALKSLEDVVEIPIEEDIYEEIVVESREELEEVLKKDVPKYLKFLLETVGLRNIQVFRLKDDVQLPEYIAEAEMPDGTPLYIEFDIDYEVYPETPQPHSVFAPLEETTEKKPYLVGQITLLNITVYRGEIPRGIVPYYYPC